MAAPGLGGPSSGGSSCLERRLGGMRAAVNAWKERPISECQPSRTSVFLSSFYSLPSSDTTLLHLPPLFLPTFDIACFRRPSPIRPGYTVLFISTSEQLPAPLSTSLRAAPPFTSLAIGSLAASSSPSSSLASNLLARRTNSDCLRPHQRRHLPTDYALRRSCSRPLGETVFSQLSFD